MKNISKLLIFVFIAQFLFIAKSTHAIAPSTPYLWTVTWGNQATRVDTTTGVESTPYNIGGSPVGVAVDISDNAWFANSNDDTVTKLNGATGETIGTYNVGDTPWGVAVDASGNVWVTNANAGTVTKLNGTTGDTIGTYNTGSGPRGVAADASGNIWVANNNDSTITKLNSATGATIGTYAGGGTDPDGLAVDASGNVWTANISGNSTTKFNGATGAVIGIYSVGDAPNSLAVDASGNIWVTAQIDDNVTKLNGSTGEVIGTYDVGACPEGVAVDASGNVWVENNDDQTVSKLNGETGAVIATYPTVGGNFYGDATGFALQYFVLGYRADEDPSLPTFSDFTGGTGGINITEGQTITTNPFIIKVKPTSDEGIEKTEFYVDDHLLCTETEADSEGIYSCSWDTSKYHSIVKVIAYDTLDNTAEIIRNTTVDPSLYTETTIPTMTELPKTGRN